MSTTIQGKTVKTRSRSEIVLASMASEHLVVMWLKSYLPDARQARSREKFDVLYRGKRIEVKTSNYDGEFWRFNIHRHGIVDETGIHAYILRLEGAPGFKAAVHLVVPAPIARTAFTISMRGLLTYWGRFFNRIDYIEPIKEFRKPSRLLDPPEIAPVNAITDCEARMNGFHAWDTQKCLRRLKVIGRSRSWIATQCSIHPMTIYKFFRGKSIRNENARAIIEALGLRTEDVLIEESRLAPTGTEGG